MWKAANGQGTIHYNEEKKLWHAKVTIEGGARRSICGKTQQDVLKKLDAFRDAIKEGRPIASQRLTVGGIVEDWLAAKRPPATSLGTWDGYRRYAAHYVRPVWGQFAPASLPRQRSRPA